MTPDYKARKIGLPTMPTKDRLLSHVAVNNATGCWEWIGCKRGGYGRTTIGSRKDGTRKTITAHRLSYLIFHGEIPEKMEVCHRCDNPSCINPDHLFVGTRKDNVDDRERKGRNIVKVGEEQPCAKLSKKAVKDARWEHAYHGTSFQKLADRYGVSKKAMQNAINGVTWKCVPYMPDLPETENREENGL